MFQQNVSATDTFSRQLTMHRSRSLTLSQLSCSLAQAIATVPLICGAHSADAGVRSPIDVFRTVVAYVLFCLFQSGFQILHRPVL